MSIAHLLGKIHNCDCMELMKQLPDKCVDLVLTDPPYGIGADKKNAHSCIRDNADWEKVNWDESRPRKEVFNEILRISKEHIIWGGKLFCRPTPSVYVLACVGQRDKGV